MTRRDVLTEKEVFDAANQLEAMGKQVTALKILSMLGGGSLTTIYKYLDSWESAKRERQANATSNEIPQAVSLAFRNVWNLAFEAAMAQNADLDSREKKLKEANEKLTLQIEQQKTELKNLTEKISALNLRVKELTKLKKKTGSKNK